MAPSVTEAAGEGTDSPGMHPSHGTRRLRTGQTSEVEVQRFFLAKTGSSERRSGIQQGVQRGTGGHGGIIQSRPELLRDLGVARCRGFLG